LQLGYPTREQWARLGRKRKKKGSHQEWKSAIDPDARITTMKDGSTYLPHNAEHAVDLTSGALLAVTLQPASHRRYEHDPADAAGGAGDGARSQWAGGRLHTRARAGRRNWQGEGKAEEQKQTYANRRRVGGGRNLRLQKLRSELTERSFARLYETGGMRRLHLRGRDNILKRLLVHGAAFNLSPIPRRTLGVGKPRQLQGACSQLSNSFSVCSYGAERENGRRDGGS
jgi:transposase